MEITPEPSDIIYQKILKIRCKTGCLNNINYLVFGHGLYCSSCLATFSDLTPDHFVNLQGLAQLLAQAITQYEQRSKGQTSQLNLIRAETQLNRKDVKKVKDSLLFDIKTVKDKSIATLDELLLECLKQNQNQPLEAIYQPDITATLILSSQAQILQKNLGNLNATDNGDGTVAYEIKENHKKPDRINKKVEKEYDELNACLEYTLAQCQSIMDEFKNDISEQ